MPDKEQQRALGAVDFKTKSQKQMRSYQHCQAPASRDRPGNHKNPDDVRCEHLSSKYLSINYSVAGQMLDDFVGVDNRTRVSECPLESQVLEGEVLPGTETADQQNSRRKYENRTFEVVVRQIVAPALKGFLST